MATELNLGNSLVASHMPLDDHVRLLRKHHLKMPSTMFPIFLLLFLEIKEVTIQWKIH